MSLHQYEASRQIEVMRRERDWPYYALIMAAMRGADSVNAAKLKRAWPAVWAELEARYNAPGGRLPGDPPGSWYGEGDALR